MLYLGQKHISNLKWTAHYYHNLRYGDFFNDSQIACFYHFPFFNSHDEIAGTGNLSMKLDAAGWLAQQDE